MKKDLIVRLSFLLATLILFGIEVLIALYAHGFVRSYLGDVLVVILLYTFFRTISLRRPRAWYVLPTAILLFSFVVEFLQLWGFCDRFGITNKVLRIIIGTGFSVIDLISYAIGILPCYVSDFLWCRNLKQKEV